jgi:tetratricopeptide (TPR) repeat protein
MDLSKTFQRLGLVAVLALIAAAVPASAQTGGVTGKVTLQDGTTCVGCPVIIERMEIKGTYKTKTNKKGEYIYIGLPLGNYKITLESPTGQTLFYFNNKRVGLGDMTEVDFDLAKEMAAAKKEQEANPEYQQKVAEQQKEEKQIAGLKAIYDQGNALFDQKQYAEAADKFQQALPLAQGKNREAVLTRLADSYAKAKDKDKAVATYQEAIQADPTSAGLHNNLGNVYADSGDIDKAKAEFQKAAELDPAGAAQYYFNLGAILYNTGKMDDAVAAFQKATSIDPKYANAYFWLGQALFGKATTGENGKVVAAPGTREAFETYLKLDPNGPNVAAAQALLQTIEGGVSTELKKEKKKGH